MTDGERERRQRFDAVFTSCSSDIVAYCGWRAASASDAQDAAAEVFLIAWRRLDELPEGDAARVWLYATARRVIANQRRSTRRQAALYKRLALHDPSWVQEPPSSDLEEALVHEAIRRLGPRDRDASGPAGAGWVVLGNPENIDPGSGTTPEEYLATVREDTGGATLRRITDAMTGLTTRQLGDGSTVYRGAVAAGLIARESGFKEGRSIRVLPFGFVAHDEAADPAAPLAVALTVGADGIVRELAVTWGRSASPWSYSVTYSGLGATQALVAPTNARPLRDTVRGG